MEPTPPPFIEQPPEDAASHSASQKIPVLPDPPRTVVEQRWHKLLKIASIIQCVYIGSIGLMVVFFPFVAALSWLIVGDNTTPDELITLVAIIIDTIEITITVVAAFLVVGSAIYITNYPVKEKELRFLKIMAFLAIIIICVVPFNLYFPQGN